MANEISYRLTVKCVNGTAIEEFPPVSGTFAQAAQGSAGGIISVGFAGEEDLVIPADVATPGLLWMRNLDATNYVTWGPKSGGVMVLAGKLEPQGMPAVFELGAAVTIRMIAATAACKVQWRLLEQ